jgi:hypothetical protein
MKVGQRSDMLTNLTRGMKTDFVDINIHNFALPRLYIVVKRSNEEIFLIVPNEQTQNLQQCLVYYLFLYTF